MLVAGVSARTIHRYKKTTKHPSPQGKTFPLSLKIPLIICFEETNLRTTTLIQATSKNKAKHHTCVAVERSICE